MDPRTQLLEEKQELERELNKVKDIYPHSYQMLKLREGRVLAELAALPPETEPPERPGPSATTAPGPGNRKDQEIDSIELGTPGKTGVVKIYYDSSTTTKEEMERRIINATNYLTITRGLLKTE